MKRLTCDIDTCLACRSCELACAVEHSSSRTLVGAIVERPLPIGRVRVLAALGEASGAPAARGVALRCRQCVEPECVYACKSGALSRDPVSGAVRCDADRCVGCWMCVMVCPLGSLRPTAGAVAAKCDLCAERDEPACVSACPTGALRWEEAAEPAPPEIPDEHRGRTHVVIGASAAGVAAAEAILEADETARVKVLSEEREPLYSRPMLYLDLTEERADVRFRAEASWGSGRIETLFGRRVESVDVAGRRVRLADGEGVDFDRLLLATGGVARWPKIEGIEKRGVIGFRTLADLQSLERRAAEVKGAVVLGGGNVGLQAACGLRARGLEVTVVVRSPHLLSQLADEEAGRMFEARFEAHGVAVRTGTDVVEILGRDEVEAVRLDTGETLRCGLVVPAKGVDPNLSVIEGTGIAVDWGVRVDERMETSVPGVFAAGDVVESPDLVTGEREVHGIWPCAFEQGRVAGRNMAGVRCEYAGAMRMNAAEFYGLKLISLGIVKPRDEGLREIARRDGPEVYRKLVFRGGILLGALLVGEIWDAGILRMLMKKRIDLTSYEENLLAGADPAWLFPALGDHPSLADVLEGVTSGVSPGGRLRTTA